MISVQGDNSVVSAITSSVDYGALNLVQALAFARYVQTEYCSHWIKNRLVCLHCYLAMSSLCGCNRHLPPPASPWYLVLREQPFPRSLNFIRHRSPEVSFSVREELAEANVSPIAHVLARLGRQKRNVLG